jgi:lysozyme family protein
MSVSSYDAALARVLAHEGGYTNHPDDPGGPTNFGITIADYRRYVKPKAAAADVKAMTAGEAKSIYRSKYWDALRCDDLPTGVDYAVFDYGVNSGIGRAAKVLQRVLDVADDGAIGSVTLAAASRAVPRMLIIAICDERLRFLKSLKTWPVFGKGWGRRVSDVKQTALAMAQQDG